MKGKIHSFQSLGTLDGPGVRFVVFMHGCNLRCGYCHNIDVCKGGYTEHTPEEVLDRILRYKEYFGTDGGVTVSGGEPLLQAEFVTELFKLCRKNGIHTALDTSGSIWSSGARELLCNCDLVLLDIKMTEDDLYKKHIGCGIDVPLLFLNELESRKIDCIVRHVVVGGLNDTEENIEKLKKILSEKSCVKGIELLPFRKMCKQKYEIMGIEFPFDCYDEPSSEKIEELKRLLI